MNWVSRKKLTLNSLAKIPLSTCFDFEGLILFVGAITSTNEWNYQQWVFMVDQTLDTKHQQLLAIKLTGPRESIDMLDAETWTRCICLFRNLEITQTDSINKLLVATATDVSSHERLSNRRIDPQSKELEGWIVNSKSMLDSCIERINELVKSR